MKHDNISLLLIYKYSGREREIKTQFFNRLNIVKSEVREDVEDEIDHFIDGRC